MLIYRNVKAVHGETKVGNSCSISLGLVGDLWADALVALLWSLVFRALRHNADSWSCAQTLPLCKNAFAIVVTRSKISNQFMF